MMSPIVPFIVASLLLPPAANLRYQFKVGLTLPYRVEDTQEMRVKTGDRPEAIVLQQKTTYTLRKHIVSFAGGQGVVEDETVDGLSERQTTTGKSTRVVQPITRVYTYTPLGKCLKVERRVPPGVEDPGSAFLEGLSFVFSEKPLSPGGKWSGAVQARGLDGKPITVHYTSRYVGPAKRQGHPCFQIKTTFYSKFSFTSEDRSRTGEGVLTGVMTAYLAQDIGQDVETTANLKLELTTTDAGQPAKTLTTTNLTFRQILHK